MVIAGGIRFARQALRGSPKADAPSCPLSVASDSLSFGDVWESPAFLWEVAITNEDASPAEILGFEASCHCLRIDPPSLVIPPRQSRSIRLTLDLRPGPAKPRATAGWDFAVEFRPRLAGASAGACRGWTLEGRVRQAFRVEPASVDFGRRSEFSPAFAPRRATVTALGPFAELTASGATASFAVRLTRSPTDPSRWDVEVEPRTDMPRGDYAFDLLIEARGGGARPVVTAVVPVRAAVVADIQTTPPLVELGAPTVGEEAEETVTLSSLSGRPLRALRVATAGDGLTAEVASNGEDGSPVVRIKQKFLAPGLNQTIAVVAVLVAGKEETVTIPVKYHALAGPSR